MIRRKSVVAMVVGWAFTVGAASAETGPRAQQVVPESGEGITGSDAKTKRSKSPEGTKVKSQPVAPGAAPAKSLSGPADAAKKGAKGKALLGPSSIPGTPGANSNDPAYEAFDQGKYLTALDLAQKAAAKGEPQAHTLLGRIYAEGLGVGRDTAAAFKWYTKAAELGDKEGAFALGLLYAQGEGVERNYTEAAKLFEAVARTGHPLANYNLGLLFLRGQGKPENPQRAFAHMQYAAEKGIVAAQYDLGTLYTTGTGTDHNAFEAAKWIGKAANAGHTDAEVEYAVILFKGHGVPPDQKRGAQLFRNAAEKGVPVAQNRLARCYAFGAGVEKNFVEAIKWHTLAAVAGIEDEPLAKILASASKADRAKAEKAAADWREKSLIE